MSWGIYRPPLFFECVAFPDSVVKGKDEMGKMAK
jgi:hypothetical protein